MTSTGPPRLGFALLSEARSPAQLRQLNDDLDLSLIFVGQILLIPGPANEILSGLDADGVVVSDTILSTMFGAPASGVYLLQCTRSACSRCAGLITGSWLYKNSRRCCGIRL